MDLSYDIVKLNIRNEFVNLIKTWIDSEGILGYDDNNLLFKCYVTKIERGMCSCIFTDSLSYEKEFPIGLFCTSSSDSITNKVLTLVESIQKNKRDVRLQIPIDSLLKLNGVAYDKIYST